MKVWERKLVPMGLILAGLLFLIAAIVRPLFKGQSINAAFLVLGAACIILGVAVWRKALGGSDSPAA